MKKSAKILLHLSLWILIFYTFFNIINAINGFPKDPGYNPYLDIELYVHALGTTIALTIPFYVGYFLTPYLFKSEKKKQFIGIAVVFGVIYPIAASIMDDGFRQSAILQSLFLFAFLNVFLVLGVGIRSLSGWIEQKRLHDKLEKQNLKSEIALLKTQLAPHFLFNTLHNIDALIHKNGEKASQSLIKLSDIMRYMLHDSKADRVPMEKEIMHIENYISLERLRIKNENFLTYSIDGDYEGIQIAPMLFIPFIENAFKHAVDSDTKNGIAITFNLHADTIIFQCENKYDPEETEKDDTQGIGLETVRKRLELLYPERHQLNIDKDGSTFKVNLKIDLDEN